MALFTVILMGGVTTSSHQQVCKQTVVQLCPLHWFWLCINYNKVYFLYQSTAHEYKTDNSLLSAEKQSQENKDTHWLVMTNIISTVIMLICMQTYGSSTRGYACYEYEIMIGKIVLIHRKRKCNELLKNN